MSVAGADLRDRILDHFTAQAPEWSTPLLARNLGEKRATINYHVSRLLAAGDLARVRSVPRRGSVEFFYRRAVKARG